ncbi:MAG: hypothetical protein COA96_00470 [SAR86 cluster bacterium]|uniref:DUF4892 domain-containing protein n=1 Tax=SAR86 cluster bacterium TaxID=2030880 RepID=A0A2A5BBE0_9GAMM|nr:MAG: hypothetical protein COA96_00470 [SAR86 cluster bacterium]
MILFNLLNFRRVCASVFLSLLTVSAFAQLQSSNGNFSDHTLINRFPESEIINRELQADVNYRLILGSLQRRRGEVTTENFERVRADVSKITYEISSEYTAGDVHQFFVDQLSSKNYTEMYSCQGRACGSSNFWANDIFGNRMLYGPERNQYYLVMNANTDPDAYIALYIITRGNRKTYAYLEIIEVGGTTEPILLSLDENATGTANDADVDSLANTLRESRSIILPSLEYVSDTTLSSSSDITRVAEMLNTHPLIQVYVVAHLQGDEPLEVLVKRSELRASTLRQALIDMGVAEQQVIAQGVGPLAPACNGGSCANRVEFVLR